MIATRDGIEEWLDEVLSDWIEATHSRDKGEKLAGRVRRLFRLARAEQPAVGRFAKYTRVVDAVGDVLDEAGHALPPEEIKEKVLAGKFKAGKEDCDVDVDKCLSAYKPKAKGDRKALRWLNGKVGRSGWTDDLFY